MEILTCVIQIIALELLVFLEIYYTFKVFFIFRKKITKTDQYEIRNREYSKVSALSLLVEIIGTFSSFAFFQRDNSNFVLDIVVFIILICVFFTSIIHRLIYLKQLVEEDVYENIISPSKAAISDGFKALFICSLAYFIVQNYVFIMLISPISAIILLVLSVFSFVVLIPKMYLVVKNRPYPERDSNHRF